MKGNIGFITPKNLTILVLVLVISGFLFYLKGGYQEKLTQKVLSVVIKDDGFYPDKIVVKKGATITWVNEGENLHWPASNFHPNHTLYPETGGCLGSKFDACRGLKKGESFSFTLNKVGVWPLHDHLSPGMVMTVEVLDEGQSASGKFLYNKNTTPEEFRNFDYTSQLEFIKIKSVKYPTETWEFIKKAFVVNNQVVGNAHEFAHIIGNAAYKKSGLKGIGMCDATFAYGCFHGVTEAMLLSQGADKVKDIEIGCLKIFPPSVSDSYTGCIHGTGHGVYTWEGGDLKKSLFDCDIISERYRQYCYDGVFMENASSVSGQTFNEKDPWKFCADLDERYHLNCARYQSQIFFTKFNSVDIVGKNCSLGPTQTLRETCYESLGYYVAQNKLGKVEGIISECAKMPNKEGVSICTTGGAIETIFQRYGDYKVSAKELCETLSLTRQPACMEATDRIIKAYDL